MRKFCVTWYALTGLGLALTGCAPAINPPDTMVQVQPGYSQRAQTTFAILQLEQAMRQGDKEGVLQAATLLLSLNPLPQALADASGWLLSNRYNEEAQAILTEAVRLQPGDLTLHIMLAEYLLEQGSSASAEELLRNFVQRHPKESVGKLELGLLLLKQERGTEALAFFEALPRAERTPSVLYYHAQALSQAGRLKQAAAMLRQALNEAPEFVEGMLELASLEEQLGNYNEARTLYNQVLALDDGNPEIQVRLIRLALLQGNPARAMEILTKWPDSFALGMAASSMFMDEGRYDLAADLLKRLSALPGAPDDLLFYQAAVAYDGQKNLPLALKYLAGVSSGNQFYDKALRLTAQILYKMGKQTEALDYVRKARQGFDQYEDFWLMELELLTNMKRYGEGLELARQAVAKWPDSSDLRFQEAYLTYYGGDKSGGLALMEKLVKDEPDNFLALNFVGYSLAEEGRDLERALGLLERAVELSPESAFILDSLAWAQYKLGRFEDAWRTMNQAMELEKIRNSHDPAMWEHYGDIALALDKKDEARQAWKRALELEPDNPSALRLKMEHL